MSALAISGLIKAAEFAIGRIWPDPQKQAEELRKLRELEQKGDLAELNAHVELLTGQLRINEKEANHKSVFVAGWRPFIGWVGGSAMAYQFIVYPLLLWMTSLLVGFDVLPSTFNAPPVLETGALFSIVTAMLGIGAMRSIDKRAGVQTDAIRSK